MIWSFNILLIQIKVKKQVYFSMEIGQMLGNADLFTRISLFTKMLHSHWNLLNFLLILRRLFESHSQSYILTKLCFYAYWIKNNVHNWIATEIVKTCVQSNVIIKNILSDSTISILVKIWQLWIETILK